MQRLNDASLRHTHPVTSSYLKTMTVPMNSYGRIGVVPLNAPGQGEQQAYLICHPFNRYLTNLKGNHVSWNAYNKRFEMVTAHVTEVHRQVDDSLLWKSTVADCFFRTTEYLTLLGNDGILQNPASTSSTSRRWTGLGSGSPLTGQAPAKHQPVYQRLPHTHQQN